MELVQLSKPVPFEDDRMICGKLLPANPLGVRISFRFRRFHGLAHRKCGAVYARRRHEAIDADVVATDKRTRIERRLVYDAVVFVQIRGGTL